LTGETTTYVYCLVESSRRPSTTRAPRGLAGATSPELITIAKRLWAVVADVPLTLYDSERLEERLKDINWVADTAVAHEAVVEYFASRASAAVVPMKLFTMFSSRERAIKNLHGRRRDIDSVLRRIRGCQEWGVRVTWRRGTSAPSGLARSQTRTSGTAFLAAKKRARDEARDSLLQAVDAAESVFAALAKLARESHRREPPESATTPPLVDAAFLVTSAREGRFRATAGRLARSCRAAGVDLLLTGPWPAYNFVQTAERV
jgi:Gas vesicle synthesis protein GvpL/GvpF